MDQRNKDRGAEINHDEEILDMDQLLRENKRVIIRTVTHSYIGRIRRVHITPDGKVVAVVLNPAGWMADGGIRHGTLMSNGLSEKTEIEMYPRGTVVFGGGLIDIAPWIHELPTKSQ